MPQFYGGNSIRDCTLSRSPQRWTARDKIELKAGGGMGDDTYLFRELQFHRIRQARRMRKGGADVAYLFVWRLQTDKWGCKYYILWQVNNILSTVTIITIINSWKRKDNFGSLASHQQQQQDG